MRRLGLKIIARALLLLVFGLASPLVGYAHSPDQGYDTAGMLNLTATADIDTPSNGGTESAGIVVVSGGVAQWVRVDGGAMGANSSTQVDYQMTVTQGGSGTPDSGTNYTAALDSTGQWTKYSSAGASSVLSAGTHSADAASWVQIAGDSSTRASAGTHTHSFSVN